MRIGSVLDRRFFACRPDQFLFLLVGACFHGSTGLRPTGDAIAEIPYPMDDVIARESALPERLVDCFRREDGFGFFERGIQAVATV